MDAGDPAAPARRLWLSWSGGKDSALALHALEGGGGLGAAPAPGRVTALLSTVGEPYGRVSMHGVRIELVREQARSAGLPLVEVAIPVPCTDAQYESRLAGALARARAEGVQAVAFGDLFLEDIRAYRERQLARAGLDAAFPLWGLDTGWLARRFLELGFRAWVVCVDTERLDRSFAGRPYDEAFLRDLPAGVDPCGERGEFHTFVYDGPVFRWPIPCRPGEVVIREGRFAYAELIPEPARGATGG